MEKENKESWMKEEKRAFTKFFLALGIILLICGLIEVLIPKADAAIFGSGELEIFKESFTQFYEKLYSALKVGIFTVNNLNVTNNITINGYACIGSDCKNAWPIGGGSGGGINVSTMNCTGTDKFMGFDNETGNFYCGVDLSGGGGNTTEDMRLAINGSDTWLNSLYTQTNFHADGILTLDGWSTANGRFDHYGDAYFYGNSGTSAFFLINKTIQIGSQAKIYTNEYAFYGFMLGLGSLDRRTLVITDTTNLIKNHGLGSTTNPTLKVFSATDPTTNSTQWISITHDKSNGIVDVGTGNIKLNDNVTIASLTGSGNSYLCISSTGVIYRNASCS